MMEAQAAVYKSNTVEAAMVRKEYRAAVMNKLFAHF